MLSSWHHQDSQKDADVASHLVDAHALGEATEVLGEVVGTAALDRWNDSAKRTKKDVVAAMDGALSALNGSSS